MIAFGTLPPLWLAAALAALLPPLWLVAALAVCVLHRLREDVNSASLMQQTRDDAKKSRMSEPVPVGDVDLSTIRISQRFAVDQGWNLMGPLRSDVWTVVRNRASTRAQRRLSIYHWMVWTISLRS